MILIKCIHHSYHLNVYPMRKKNNQPEFKHHLQGVSDCNNLEEFYQKYYRRDRYHMYEPDFRQQMLSSGYSELFRFGHASLSHHDNVTGETIRFIPTYEQMAVMKRQWGETVELYDQQRKRTNELDEAKRKKKSAKHQKRSRPK